MLQTSAQGWPPSASVSLSDLSKLHSGSWGSSTQCPVASTQGLESPPCSILVAFFHNLSLVGPCGSHGCPGSIQALQLEDLGPLLLLTLGRSRSPGDGPAPSSGEWRYQGHSHGLRTRPPQWRLEGALRQATVLRALEVPGPEPRTRDQPGAWPMGMDDKRSHPVSLVRQTCLTKCHPHL